MSRLLRSLLSLLRPPTDSVSEPFLVFDDLSDLILPPAASSSSQGQEQLPTSESQSSLLLFGGGGSLDNHDDDEEEWREGRQTMIEGEGREWLG